MTKSIIGQVPQLFREAPHHHMLIFKQELKEDFVGLVYLKS